MISDVAAISIPYALIGFFAFVLAIMFISAPNPMWFRLNWICLVVAVCFTSWVCYTINYEHGGEYVTVHTPTASYTGYLTKRPLLNDIKITFVNCFDCEQDFVMINKRHIIRTDRVEPDVKSGINKLNADNECE